MNEKQTDRLVTLAHLVLVVISLLWGSTDTTITVVSVMLVGLHIARTVETEGRRVAEANREG